ncbi:DUF777 family protein (plasmid) [Borrelia sp. A-FGy1]|uniref:DUF777 family protein n=1 Tax=Borrelia sp. A-FGy1 TaxID=2608247 RepID=UPI0015F6A623|nr:DUF777 family protein [Borrelia sp. A-FGy1]QMU99800.1 DUF777 family protein [Borrelia sp. A-FGy1]
MQSRTQKYSEFRYYTNLENMAYVHHETLDKMCENIFISRIGIVKEFDYKTQEGVVVIPEFGSLNIETKNISNMKLHLQTNDKVILLQSSVNLFDIEDTNYFDKTYFYIINSIDIKTIEKAVIDIDQFELKNHTLDIKAEESINIESKDLNINANKIKIKASNPISISTNNASLYDILNSLINTLEKLKFVQELDAMKDLQLQMPILKTKLNKLLL